MPLVNIHIIKGARSKEVRKLADVIQGVMLDTFKAPPRDRFQIITQHEPGEIIAEDVNLGYKRTDKLVILHIFQQGRDKGTKESTYAALAAALERETNLSGDDLIISVSTNTKDDWSLGRGRPAFACGDL